MAFQPPGLAVLAAAFREGGLVAHGVAAGEVVVHLMPAEIPVNLRPFAEDRGLHAASLHRVEGHRQQAGAGVGPLGVDTAGVGATLCVLALVHIQTLEE